MPSYQYLRDMDKNTTPNDPPPEYTKKEKAKNWWHYHWLIVAAVIAAVAIITYFIVSVVFQTTADYTIGIISTTDLPSDLTDKISQELTPYFDDRNGDGEVRIDVFSYSVNYGQGEDTSSITVSSSNSSASSTITTANDPYSQMAGITKLSGAISSNDQFIFLVNSSQAELYQEAFGIFGTADGQIADENTSLDDLAPLVKNCPLLSQLDLTYTTYTDKVIDGQDLLGDFYIALRPVYGTSVEKKSGSIENWENDKKFYQILTENATY